MYEKAIISEFGLYFTYCATKRSAVQCGVVGASHVTCSKNMASAMFQCEECKIYYFSMEVFVRHPCVLQGNKHAVNQNHLKQQ